MKLHDWKLYSWRIVPFVLFLFLALFLWRGLSLDPQNLPSAQLGKPLPFFKLPVLGEHNEELTPVSMHGHVVLLNVWASWCEACAREQVFLLQLAHDGVPMYGLNYKDKADDAVEWLNEWGNPYKLIGSDFTGKIAIDLGVYGAPETFLIDKAGLIQYRHAGVLTPEIWQQDFLPRFKQLEQVQ